VAGTVGVRDKATNDGVRVGWALGGRLSVPRRDNYRAAISARIKTLHPDLFDVAAALRPIVLADWAEEVRQAEEREKFGDTEDYALGFARQSLPVCSGCRSRSRWQC